ncbi:hypothetical protein [Roseateles sp. PN1]|uniref:hypothetical protein n=1 Tax=Roseateles sp. PN1 TaxID=3137372 RepID=UPI003139B75A
MKTFKNAIDKAADLCGSQRGLAERLGVKEQQISAAKLGKQPLNKERIAVLGCLLDTDPAELWELQEIANLPRRNPFLHAASAMLSAFLCVILSVGGNDAKADAYGANCISERSGIVHIVGK